MLARRLGILAALTLSGCGGPLAVFGSSAGEAFEPAAKPMYEQCMHFLSHDKGAYLETRWAYCDSVDNPDRHWVRRYKEKPPALEKLAVEMSAPIAFPGEHKVETHREEHDLGGESVELLNVVLVSADEPWRDIYLARTHDNYVLACAVDFKHSYEPKDHPRTVARQRCYQSLAALHRAIRR
ncbi:MAG: hypothetical protein H6747_12685 [Deltaproteobacteria bacterium]|nr:hypothetical protein [Deltaproteobacteria bacterium]